MNKYGKHKKTIWISYDLGIRGDYEGIYTWLDEHCASECGDNIALLKYEFTGELIETLRANIKKSVEISKKTRIYVIWHDDETGQIKGRFVFGSRKSAAWSGYAVGESDIEDVGI